ncbi:MAG TPA: DUF2231 domain-containing protein [Gemmatimonadales bacterium]
MRLLRRFPAVLLLLAAFPAASQAQDQRDEQFYYPGKFNWAFLKSYPEGGRLFNAFDYGHAVLYERLYTRPPREREAALEKEYQFLTTNLLIRPPRFAVAEEVIEPAYAKMAWQAKQMFDWAHVLHRQIYDIYADERLGPAARDSLIERVTDYYLSRKAHAFAAAPKSMALMDEQYFSQGFRKAHPKFNGLIWAYHWLQVGLYEPLILGKTPAEKQAGVKATLARFWSMLEEAPQNFPQMMPMTSAIAPTFSAKHPRAAVIFDNLHMMHDIISDILVADTIPHGRKRTVIYAQLAEFRDGTRNVISLDEWRDMAGMMGGIAMMGGPATDLLKPVAAGGGMAGMRHGAMKPAPDTAAHAHPATPTVTTTPDTAEHVHPAPAAARPEPAAPQHQHPAQTSPAPPATLPRVATSVHQHEAEPAAAATTATSQQVGVEEPDAVRPAGWFPMHSGHPLVVHFPLVALLLAVLLDAVAALRKSPAWRGAATLLWWVGLAGAAAAIGTGLLAYGRVDHSDLAHQAMIRHRNLALAAVAILLASALWRWRRPLSLGAAAAGIVGALGLGAAGYLGGDMVYRHGVGIPTNVLHEVMEERGGHARGAATDSTGSAAPNHTHSPGEKHEH